MRLLHLIKKNDRVGMAAYFLCELSTFAVAYISRRRTYKTRGIELLLVFAHINTNKSVLRAEHQLCQGLCKIGLAYTG